MATIRDVSILDTKNAKTKRVPTGLERLVCVPEPTGSKNLTVYRRRVNAGKQLEVQAGRGYDAHGGPLDYFEVQAWRSFKTAILSEETQGLKWFYERETPGAALVEWNQS